MSATVSLHSPAMQTVLGRSALYQLLSLGFSYPTDTSLADLAAFVVDLSEHEIIEQLDLVAPLRSFAGTLDMCDPIVLACEHSRLFGGEVICSAHETEYSFDPFSKSRQLADVAGFYEAFGFRVAQDRRGLPDFISTELEFMSLLTRKSVYACVQGWSDEQKTAENAFLSFLQDHLGRWVLVFCQAVGSEARDGIGYYSALTELGARFVTGEIERAGIRPEQVHHRGISLGDVEPFKCGLDSTPAGDEAD